jgi:hypothetical protein
VHGTAHDIDGGRGRAAISSRRKATCSTVKVDGAELLTARADPSPREDRAKERVLWPDPSGNGRKMRRNQGPWARAGATGNPCNRPKFSAGGCLDRTQEVGGSSPPSSIKREALHTRGFCRFGDPLESPMIALISGASA